MFILQAVPWWLFLFIGGGVALIGVPVLRKMTEGTAYALSYSATYGDLALAISIACGAKASEGFVGGVLVYEPIFNTAVVVVLVLAGLIMDRKPGASQTPVDRIHALIVIPFVGYLGAISALVIYEHNSLVYYVIGMAGLSIWVELVHRDLNDKRLDQLRYMALYGETAVPGLGWITNQLNSR